MKISALFCLTILILLSIARADLTVVQSIESSAGTNKITIKIKGERARIEVNPKSSMIVDTKSGEVLTLIPQQKAVMRLSAEEAKDLGNKARQLAKVSDSSLEIATPKPTGKKEKINGYEAEEYTAETLKYKATYWVAKSYPDWQTILRQLKLLQNKAFAAVHRHQADYYDFPGLPIRTKIKEANEEATITITSISQAPIPESEFAVPADYMELGMPRFEVRDKAPAVPYALPKEPNANQSPAPK